MDEPCSALDPMATHLIEELMQELCNHYTIIIVTHNMQQAARISDMAAFFKVWRITCRALIFCQFVTASLASSKGLQPTCTS